MDPDKLDIQYLLKNLFLTTREKTIAIYTVVAEKRCHIILVTPELRILRTVEIRSSDLAKKIALFRAALQDPRIDPRAVSRELYDIIIKPIENDLHQSGAKNLMWSLDGGLRYIPIAALFDGEKYMAEKFNNVNFTPASLASLTYGQNPSKHILAMGATAAKTVTLDKGGEAVFPALPGVALELKAIFGNRENFDPTGLISGKILLDSMFTKEKMREELLSGKYNILHIATHFRASSNVENSFFVLGDGAMFSLNEFRGDQQVFARTDLLVLSGSDTGVFDPGSDGREIEGFAYVAQAMGAKSVITGLWNVSDSATVDLMEEFYKQWVSSPNMTKSEALRQAQLALLYGKVGPKNLRSAERIGPETTSPFRVDSKAPFAHPYYWAPFVLYGNWK